MCGGDASPSMSIGENALDVGMGVGVEEGRATGVVAVGGGVDGVAGACCGGVDGDDDGDDGGAEETNARRFICLGSGADRRREWIPVGVCGFGGGMEEDEDEDEDEVAVIACEATRDAYAISPDDTPPSPPVCDL